MFPSLRRARLSRCASLLAALAAATGVLGAQARTRGEEDLFLRDIPSVVGASRFDQSATEAPASVTVITSEDIATYGWRTLADLLRTVRGVQVTNDRAYPQIGMRGFGVPGDFNTRLLLLVDGVRQNENVYDGAYFTSMIVDPALIDRVEIIRGPASSLYGTNALLGIVNVVTVRGRAKQGAQVSVAAERFATREVSISGGTRLPRGLELVGSTNLFRSGGRDFHFPELDSPATSNGIVRGADGEEREQFFGKASFGPATLQASLNHRRKGLPTALYGTSFADPRQRYEDNLRSLALQVAPKLGENTTATLLASTHQYDFNGRYPYEDGLYLETARGLWTILDGQVARQFRGRHRLLAGAAYYANQRQQLARNSGDGLLVTNEATPDVWALFAQADVRVAQRLTVTGGLRRDQVDGRPPMLTPRAGLIANLAEGSALKLLYGSAFRAPNVSERFNDDGGVSTLANPGLRSERIETFEFLVERLLSRYLKGTVSAYGYDTHDLIDQVTVDSLVQYQNLGRVDGVGVEAELEFDFGRITGRMSYAAQRSRDRIHRHELVNSPQHLGLANLAMPTPLPWLRLAVEARGVSARRAVSGARVAPYAVANIILSTVRRTRGPQATLALLNAFNARYDDPLSRDAAATMIRQDPASARLALTWAF